MVEQHPYIKASYAHRDNTLTCESGRAICQEFDHIRDMNMQLVREYIPPLYAVVSLHESV